MLLQLLIGVMLWMPKWQPGVYAPISNPRPLDNTIERLDPKAATANREGLDFVWTHGLGD